MSFKLFGVLFEVSYIFACGVVLFIAYDKSGMFIPLLISVIIHELSHILFLRLFCCKIKSVKLIVGTVGIEYYENLKDSEKLISLFAGPFTNLLCAIIFYNLKLDLYFSVNLILSLLNFLPIKGLDGGDILEIILKRFIPKKIIEIIQFSFSVIFFITIFFAFIKYGKDLISNCSIILFIIYLILPFILKKLG